MIIDRLLQRRRPGLLVSVRSADEALAALVGGADVIDVKEPKRGSLGAADANSIAEVVRVVAGRAPVTAAAGELVDLLPDVAANSLSPMPDGVALVKIGLAHCAAIPDWQAPWRTAVAALCSGGKLTAPRPVAVVYADWQSAGAPPPDAICHAAAYMGCRVVLIDTCNKSVGCLFDHWPTEELRLFVQRTIARGVAVVLAGSLAGANVLAAAELGPQLVAVRAAACELGRSGNVSRIRVEQLRHALATAPAVARAREPRASESTREACFRHKEFS